MRSQSQLRNDKYIIMKSRTCSKVREIIRNNNLCSNQAFSFDEQVFEGNGSIKLIAQMLERRSQSSLVVPATIEALTMKTRLAKIPDEGHQGNEENYSHFELTWRSGYCYLNKGECDLNQSKHDSIVERVAKNNS